MTGVIFRETLRRNWRQIIYWGLGLFLWGAFPFLMLPDQEALDGYGELVEDLPGGMLDAFGIGDVSLATPEGFVGYSYFGFLLLIMAVFAVVAGLNITANEEESGVMDVLLSLPVERWKVIVEKFAAYSLIVIAIALIGFLGLLFGDQLANFEVDITVGRYLEGSFNLVPGTLLIMAVTVFFGVLVRRRGLAMGLAGAFVVVSYLLDSIGRAAQSDFADAIRNVSLFAHYDGTSVLVDGAVWGSIILLLVVTAGLLITSLRLFDRRDIAV